MTKNILLTISVVISNMTSALFLHLIWLSFFGGSESVIGIALCILWIVGLVCSICILCQYWKEPLRTEAEKLVQEALDQRKLEEDDIDW